MLFFPFETQVALGWEVYAEWYKEIGEIYGEVTMTYIHEEIRLHE